MPGPKLRLTEQDLTYISARVASGKSDKTIAAELTAKGESVSYETVRRARLRMKPKAKHTEPGLERAPDVLPGELPPALAAEATDLMAELARSVPRLREQIAKANASDNVRDLAALQRTLNSTLVIWEKMRPPPVANPEERPDWQRAAAECKALMLELLDRTDER